MKKSGQITVFLSLILLCIVSLLCGLLESARSAGTRFYLKTAADSAMDSLFSGYHRKAWEEYRIFLLEYKDEEELMETWESFLTPYLDDHGWYPMRKERTELYRLNGITDDHGTYFQQEILDYMRYGIWDMDQDETRASKLLTNLTEAKSAERVSRTYAGHAKETMRLEEALEAIAKSLERQRELLEYGYRAIDNRNGSSFRKIAGKLKKEANRIPGLVKTYEARADSLADHLKETKMAMAADLENLSGSVNQAMEEELKSYEEYTAQDGVKRAEIEALVEKMEVGLTIIERAVERSYEVEDEMEAWENSDDDGGGPDREALWQSVAAIWGRVEIPGLSFRPGIGDKKKQKLLEKVKSMADTGLLSLVLPEGTRVSDGVIADKDLPSIEAGKGEQREEGRGQSAAGGTGLYDKLMTDEYASRFFINFRSGEEMKKGDLRYEQEYVAAGKDTDAANLKRTVEELLLIREGFNFIHILTDPQKRAEARELAVTITGAVGLIPLVEVLTFFIMSVWALGEAMMDIKALLCGKKTPLLKSRESWNLSLERLLKIGEENSCDSISDEADGLNYGDYIKLLFFTEKTEVVLYRLMDVIQINLRRDQRGFAMRQCAYGGEIRAEVTGKHFFFPGQNRYYILNLRTEKSY